MIMETMPCRRERMFLSPPLPSGDEERYVMEAFASNYIAPVGPMIDAFEAEFTAYTGIPHCVAVNSGTAALHLALREAGVGPGDIVLAPSLTFIATVSPAIHLGAEPVFIDADPATWNMDVDLLKAELAELEWIGSLPKAVICTDLYGQCCNLPAILNVCRAYEVPVICDSAEAMGATYREQQTGTPRHAGYGATAAAYSFNGNKIITSSGGGMLASHDGRLIAHARKLAAQAREDVPHYEHTEIGYNYRISNIVAAIGRAQLGVLDGRVAQRRAVSNAYRTLLHDVPGISFMPEASYGTSNRWLTVILLDPEVCSITPEDVRQALEVANIEARPLWKPMHMQPVFANARLRRAKTTPGVMPSHIQQPSVSEELFRRGLCLPSGPAMSEADITRVAFIVRYCVKGESIRKNVEAFA